MWYYAILSANGTYYTFVIALQITATSTTGPILSSQKDLIQVLDYKLYQLMEK